MAILSGADKDATFSGLPSSAKRAMHLSLITNIQGRVIVKASAAIKKYLYHIANDIHTIFPQITVLVARVVSICAVLFRSARLGVDHP